MSRGIAAGLRRPFGRKDPDTVIAKKQSRMANPSLLQIEAAMGFFI